MQVDVDFGLCQGHAQCEDAAPQVFRLREDGLAEVVQSTVDDPTLVARVLDAQRRCPVDAILTSSSQPA